MKLLRLA